MLILFTSSFLGYCHSRLREKLYKERLDGNWLLQMFRGILGAIQFGTTGWKEGS
jgi:hypothetical protein